MTSANGGSSVVSTSANYDGTGATIGATGGSSGISGNRGIAGVITPAIAGSAGVGNTDLLSQTGLFEVPNATDCETCHSNQPGRFIGVSELQLDYDYAGLTVAKLQTLGACRNRYHPQHVCPATQPRRLH